MSLDIQEAIRTRRVAKYYDKKPVPDEMLWTVLEAARWAPVAGNRRIHRFICINDRQLLKQIKLFTPGMTAGLPAALIILCIDWALAKRGVLLQDYPEAYYDVGAAGQNMLLMAHGLGLVAGPMSSYNKAALRVLLNLPEKIEPHLFIGLGFPAEPPAYLPKWPKTKLHINDLVQWGPYKP
jgi:nitroreductase